MMLALFPLRQIRGLRDTILLICLFSALLFLSAISSKRCGINCRDFEVETDQKQGLNAYFGEFLDASAIEKRPHEFDELFSKTLHWEGCALREVNWNFEKVPRSFPTVKHEISFDWSVFPETLRKVEISFDDWGTCLCIYERTTRTHSLS